MIKGGVLKNLWRHFNDVIIHNDCLICGNPCDGLICEECKTCLDSEMFDSYMVRCPACFQMLISFDYSCPRCKGSTCFPQENYFPLYCIADYNANLSYSLLHRFKFLNDKRVAKVIAMYLQRAVDALDPSKKSFIIPIPCSNKTLKERGWDQMVEICRFIDRPMLKILENIQFSNSEQKLLDRKERLEKEHEKRFKVVCGSTILKDESSTTSVIVVDDVTTTYSTINSAVHCLRAFGFKDIKAAVWLYDYKA